MIDCPYTAINEVGLPSDVEYIESQEKGGGTINYLLSHILLLSDRATKGGGE